MKSPISTPISIKDNLSFDIEIPAASEEELSEIYNFEKVKAKPLKKEPGVYEIKCQLTDLNSSNKRSTCGV